MTQHIDNATPENTISCNFPEYFKIAPIIRGADRRKWKAPTTPGWNSDFLAEQYTNVIPPGMNGGLCHKQSGTCAIDIDNLRESHELFRSRGLNLAELLMKGLQISSGKDNRSKLLYRLPPLMVMLGTGYPRTIQQSDASGMVLEFRCVYGSGNTCQDVLPGSVHPETNEVYIWAGAVASLADIPIIPDELMQWWQELISVKKAPAPKSWAGHPDTPETRHKIAKALTVLNPDMPEPEWRNIGLAINDTGWPDAFNIWDEWSAKGMNYDPDASWDKWSYMNPGGGINLNYLYSEAFKVNPAWQKQTPEELTAKFAELQPAHPDNSITIDNETQQVVPDMASMMRSINKESDSNHMEMVCEYIAQHGGNRAMQSDYLKEACDQSNYDRTVLGPMLSKARKDLSKARNNGGAVIVFTHTNDNDAPLSVLANTELVAQTYGFKFKFNLMTRRVDTIRDLSCVPADVREVSQLTDFEDLCMQHRLDDKRVQKHRDRIAYNNSHHPFVDYLITEKLLNGPFEASERDEVEVLFSSLILEDGANVELSRTLLKRWLISVVAAAHMRDEKDYDSWEIKPPAPRGVLVLQGQQYVGKTRWFKTVTPHGMFKEGLQLNYSDMNHMKTATNRLIVEISEADHTTKGKDANKMKTIIGRDVDEVRLAFHKEEVVMVRRNVFCATVNPAEFLDDEQNTRWWVINLKKIDFELSASVNIKRLWQQVYALWTAGEPYHLTHEEIATLNRSNETFRDCSAFEQYMLDTFDFSEGWEKLPKKELSYYTSTELREKAEKRGIRNTRDFTSAMKRLTSLRCSPKDNRGSGAMQPRKYWKLPPLFSVDAEDSGSCGFEPVGEKKTPEFLN